jgi:flavin-dependent dehydrogenase
LPDAANVCVDVCIAGAGPAGAALALRLAQLGRSVVVVEKAAFPRMHVGESLTSGVLPMLDILGVRDAMENAGFLRAGLANVLWAGELRSHQLHGGGLQVDRGRFDSILLCAAAVNPLVRIHQPARIVRHDWLGKQWRIVLHTGETLYARYLANATGRARLLGGVKTQTGAATLAIYAYWKSATGFSDNATLIEAGRSEWYWGAPLPGGIFNATVFVDPATKPDASLYFDLLRKSNLLRPRLEQVVACSAVRVCDATAYSEQMPISRHDVHVGDAALSIDPLASQGIETAIGMAIHAAVTINTMIDRPADAEFAMEFYGSRLRSSAAFHSASAARFYREQYAAYGESFWSRRATMPEQETRKEREAAQLRPNSLVRLSSELSFTTVAAVDGTYVVRQEGVQLDDETFAYVGDGVSVAGLLKQVSGPMLAVQVVRLWSARMAVIDALRILDWAHAKGLVQELSSKPSGRPDPIGNKQR